MYINIQQNLKQKKYYTYIYIYIYIYTYSLHIAINHFIHSKCFMYTIYRYIGLLLHRNVYIYIYIFVLVYVYIYIYIYIKHPI